MELVITPTSKAVDKAKSVIKMMDKVQNLNVTNGHLVSKLAKNIKTVKAPVARYFDSPAQVSSYYAEGEYDLIAIFKMLDYEAYFDKAVQKKVGLFSKSGFSIHCNNDEIKHYVNSRFKLMELQTGKSLQALVKQLARYLIICSNAFVVKVRDKNFEYAESYKKDGKEMAPVVGYFLAHPTTMKPRFKYVKDPDTGLPKIELDKWIHVNRRGILKSFELQDVCHFTLKKQDGLVFGTPEIVPVIDDIRVLRKIEEDCQLLIYRDLFPIIHYAIEKPTVLDHMGGLDEITQAKNDMQNIIQDGGIATDNRHEIKFIGSEGKGLDVMPMLEYFQQRVFSGLGVSPTDMGMSSEANKSSAENASEQVIDYVKDIQQDVSEQFKQMILTELLLQSPFSMNELFDPENEVTLKFEEVDIEWKVRTENHEADLFAKGVNTIHETRNKMNKKDITDDDLMYTFAGLYQPGEPPGPAYLNSQHGDKYIQRLQQIAHAEAVPTTTTTTGGGSPAKKTHVKPHTQPLKPAKTTQSAAKADPIKTSKTNSNIVKHKDELKILDHFMVQDQLTSLVTSLNGKSDSQKKLSIMIGTKLLYDNIKSNMNDAIRLGSEKAYEDLNMDNCGIRISHDLFTKVDRLRDDVSSMILKDENSVNRVSTRILTADRTEAQRAYNYGYAKTLLDNGVNKFIIYSDSEEVSEDSAQYIGKEVELNFTNITEVIPPFRPNSKLKIKAPPIIKDELLNNTVDNIQFGTDLDPLSTTYIIHGVDKKLSDSIEEVNKLSSVHISELNRKNEEYLQKINNDIELMKIELNTKILEVMSFSDATDKYEDIMKRVDALTAANNQQIQAVIASNARQMNELVNSIKEINIQAPNVSITNSQKSTKKIGNIVRNDQGQIIAIEYEEADNE
jgi:hypothetical protein